ncbi:HTH-type transcriptional repressor of NAD biosynthesis genes [Cryobacterium sp. MP_3.1]|nr:HTH-type transcriptional repressor of NAD biosynthesis genes [Cryobacterium sp. MP_3.1]
MNEPVPDPLTAAVPVPATRFGHGLVLGKFYPLHAGHSALIRTALSRCDRVTVQLFGASVESIPLSVREGWLREEHPTAHVVSAIDDAPVDFDSADAWDEHMVLIRALLDAPVDAVFSSDPYGAELAARLGAAWVQVDPGRRHTPVSGTAIRADVPGHWWALAPAVRAWLTPRVVVLGAESTGSTTLAEALADHYDTAWVPEYGREHSETRVGGLDTPWRSDEFDVIVDRQIGWENQALRRVPRPLLICDTDVLATTLWHERYVGPTPAGLVARAAAHPPALYLLTGDEIPFVQDGLRDGEHIRHAMQHRFRQALAGQDVPWLEVTGSVPERLAQAAVAIDRMLAGVFDFALPLEQHAALEAAGTAGPAR